MDNFSAYSAAGVKSETQLAAFFKFTYLWMAVGLLITAATSFFVGQNVALLSLVYRLYFLFFIAQIGLVFLIQSAMKKASFMTVATYFMLYSFITGLTLSGIFMVFELGSIFGTFLVSAGSFASLSLYGMVTNRDLSAVGKFLYMALCGLMFALILSFFIRTSALSFAINIVGVLIFAGLTVYDTNKLRHMVLQNDLNIHDESGRKLALYGALTLYLDFINMFLFLLRIFGKRR
ncbi:MAG: Bax inhibitor-1/YccA family protein [Culicoidibacterales bacterium]